MKKQIQKSVVPPPFGLKDKVGYMFGDIGNNMTFQLAGAFLMVFYTQVLAIQPELVGTLFLVSRFIDAFTDVGMGIIVDRTPPNKDGKFLPWIKRMAVPVILAGFLMYQASMAEASYNIRVLYMFFTYILWGSFAYTGINIPYGSMASAITSVPEERTELSVWRTRGANLAVMIVGVITPFIIYATNDQGQQVVRSGSSFTLAAAIFSIIGLISYYITYKFTHERVDFTHNETVEEKRSLGELLGKLFRSRSLVAITVSSIFLLMTMLLMMSMYNYIFPYYYNSSTAISTINFLNPIISIILVTPIASYLGQSIGKKEASVIGLIIGSVVNFILFFLRPDSVIVFMILTLFAYSGLNIFNALVWAMITDVIDDQEVKSGNRDDGTVYAVNSFARKVGQAFAGGLGGYALALAGFISGAETQTHEVLENIFNITTLGPAIGFFITAISLLVLYPLSREKTLNNQYILSKDRQI